MALLSPVLLLAASAHASSKVIEQYGTIEPKRLTVHLDLDPAESAYTGTSTITFEHSKPIDEVTVNLSEGMEITGARFYRGGRSWDVTLEDLGDETLAIRPAKEIPLAGFALPRKKRAARGEPLFAKPSFAWLELEFSNQVNDQAYGLYHFDVGEQDYLVTQFEADDAREAFPCIDRPDAKVPFWLSLTVPSDLVALSNGPIVDSETHDDGTRTVVFGATRPLPTYAMALAVGPYTSLQIPDLPDRAPGKIYTVPGREDAARTFAREIGPLFHELEDWFGTPYPYRKLDFLAVPEFAFGGMENPGLVVLTERTLVPADQRTPGARRWQQELIAHEIAHMWFGDLVTLKWWDDFWLNESFAEWAGNRAAAATTDDEGFAFRQVSATQGALSSDGSGTMRPVRTDVDPTRIFETTNFLAYPKGEALLAMVEAWIGEDAFQEGVRAYLDAHEDGNATSADLFAALSEASGEDVGAMLGPWLDRPGAPLVTLEPAEDGTLTWAQRRYLAAGAEAEADVWWTTPLVVRWADDAGVHTQSVLLDGPTGTATLPVEGTLKWVFPTADGVGYLVWAQPGPWLDALLEAAPEALSAPERAAVVGNLDLLAGAGVLDGAALLDLVEQFAEEPHPSVIGRLLSAQGTLKWVLGDEHRKAWSAYVAATRWPMLDKLGLEPVADENSEIPGLRGRLAGELMETGDDRIREVLLPVGEAFLEDESAYDPNLTELGLRVVAEKAGPEFFDVLIEKADATSNPRFRSLYLQTLGALGDDASRDRALQMALDPETPARDMFPLLAATGGDSDEDQEFELDWVIANYDALIAKLPPQGSSWLARTGSGCDADRWDRAKAFFGAEERRTPGVDRSIAQGTEQLALCQAARAAHTESVRAWLAAYAEANPSDEEEAD